MKRKKYLFVCKHNFTRSKHGAEFFKGYLDAKNIVADVDSAGTGFISRFLGKKINSNIIEGVDLVFVMEKYMKDFIVRNFDLDKNKIVVLGIKDVYGFLRRKSIKDLDVVLSKVSWERYL